MGQVREMWDAHDDSSTKWIFVHRNIGCCVAGIMVPHPLPNSDDYFDDHPSSDDKSKI